MTNRSIDGGEGDARTTTADARRSGTTDEGGASAGGTVAPTVRAGDPSRSDRDAGERERGDDDWGALDSPQELGPADMPTSRSDPDNS
jgi:hypothetical protein